MEQPVRNPLIIEPAIRSRLIKMARYITVFSYAAIFICIAGFLKALTLVLSANRMQNREFWQFAAPCWLVIMIATFWPCSWLSNGASNLSNGLLTENQSLFNDSLTAFGKFLRWCLILVIAGAVLVILEIFWTMKR